MANVKVSGVGPARVAILASHGIDTAGDIIHHRLLGVPGFGPATVSKLLSWRKTHEATFRFDPNRGVSPFEIAAVERDIATQRTKLESEVAAGLARLRAVTATHTARQRALQGRATELLPQYAQALADIAVIPEDRKTYKRLLAISGAAIILSLITSIEYHFTESQTRSLVASAPGPVTAIATGETSQVVEAPPPSQLWTTSGVKSASIPRVPQITIKQAANVREKANSSSAVVRIAPRGAKLRMFSRSGGWVQVGEGVPWGLVHSSLVSFLSPEQDSGQPERDSGR